MPPTLKRANSGFKVVGKPNNLLIHAKAHTATAFTTTLCRYCVKNAGGGQAAARGWLEGITRLATGVGQITSIFDLSHQTRHALFPLPFLHFIFMSPTHTKLHWLLDLLCFLLPVLLLLFHFCRICRLCTVCRKLTEIRINIYDF